MKNIDTLIFDVGNVLLDWDPDGLYREIVGRNDYSSHPLRKIIGSPLWLQMDRGHWGVEECLRRLLPYYPDHIEEITRFFREVAWKIKAKEGGFEFAAKCKDRGFRLLLLSNFGKEYWDIVTERYDGFKLFDGGVISWEVETIKPEEKIYRLLIEKYSLDPTKCFFIDDVEENASAAAALGINTIHLSKDKVLSEELNFLLK